MFIGLFNLALNIIVTYVPGILNWLLILLDLPNLPLPVR
jgi:hypothetical protein